MAFAEREARGPHVPIVRGDREENAAPIGAERDAARSLVEPASSRGDPLVTSTDHMAQWPAENSIGW